MLMMTTTATTTSIPMPVPKEDVYFLHFSLSAAALPL